jgi:hypothetical protein
VTVDTCSPAKAATAVRGSVTVICAPVGRIGWPAFVAAGKDAVICALIGRVPAGNAHA